MQPEFASAAESFHHYFRPVLATTAEHRREVYRIRYEVYCREFGFEREEDCIDEMERDEYDEFSLHCLLVHQASGQAAGCIRLVRPEQGRPDFLLPIEKHMSAGLGHMGFDRNIGTKVYYGEISRLAVRSDFRRRRNEHLAPFPYSDSDAQISLERRHLPFISLGLYLAAASMGLLSGLDGVLAAMEPRLARHLARFSIRFNQLGPVVDYHGQRAPYAITRETLLHELEPEVGELLATIHDEMEQQFRRDRLRVVT